MVPNFIFTTSFSSFKERSKLSLGKTRLLRGVLPIFTSGLASCMISCKGPGTRHFTGSPLLLFAPFSCRHTCPQTPFSQALLTTYPHALLALEKAALAGMGPAALVAVGLPWLCRCKHRAAGVTSLLMLQPGCGVFSCTSVS